MPRGVYPRKKKVAKKKVAKRAAPRKSRGQRTVDIPAISRSSLRSSISDTPTPGGLASRVAPAATAVADLFDVTCVDYPFAIKIGDGSDIDWGNCLDSCVNEDDAFQCAVEEAKRLIEDNGDDEVEVYVVGVIGKVTAKREEVIIII